MHFEHEVRRDEVAAEVRRLGYDTVKTGEAEFEVYVSPAPGVGEEGAYLRVSLRFDGPGNTELASASVNETNRYAIVQVLHRVGVDALDAVLTAVSGGVSTERGLDEVIAGAPVEWVRAFEEARER